MSSHISTIFTRFLGWQGRFSRSDWWLCWCADLGLAVFFVYVFNSSAYKALGLAVPPIFLSAFLMWATTCANIKRFHDRNKPAIWALVAFLPIVGTAWVIIELGFMRGSRGRNAYGEDSSTQSAGRLPHLPEQQLEARAELLRKIEWAMAAKRTASPHKEKSPPVHTRQQPLIQYGYKRPERTVTRDWY